MTYDTNLINDCHNIETVICENIYIKLMIKTVNILWTNLNVVVRDNIYNNVRRNIRDILNDL